jgi:hypothetical protein
MLSDPLTGTIGPEYAKVVRVVCVVWVPSEVPLDVDMLVFVAWPIPVESKAIPPSRMIMRIEIASRECLKISIGTRRQ